jgi:hypothetical protein
MMKRTAALALLLLCAPLPSLAQLDQLKQRLGLGDQAGLSDSQVASGLKEALRVGAEIP